MPSCWLRCQPSGEQGTALVLLKYEGGFLQYELLSEYISSRQILVFEVMYEQNVLLLHWKGNIKWVFLKQGAEHATPGSTEQVQEECTTPSVLRSPQGDLQCRFLRCLYQVRLYKCKPNFPNKCF